MNRKNFRNSALAIFGAFYVLFGLSINYYILENHKTMDTMQMFSVLFCSFSYMLLGAYSILIGLEKK